MFEESDAQSTNMFPHLRDTTLEALAQCVIAIVGFLWFNCFPAQVFMGDTGSLPMGALLGLAALVSRQELLLVLVGQRSGEGIRLYKAHPAQGC